MIEIKDASQQTFNICLCGGTFDRLHPGHHALLNVAFILAKYVVIGVTIDEMVNDKVAADLIQPLHERIKHLTNYLNGCDYQGRFELAKLTKPEGTSETFKKADAMVITEETHILLDTINSVRVSRGLTPLIKIFIPYILTSECRPYRSTDLRQQIRK